MSIILFVGCARPSPAPQVYYPITSGFHKTLPQRDTRILVWGMQPVVGMAMTWLQSHRFTVIPPDDLRRLLPSGLQDTLTYTSEDVSLILRHGKSVDAELVVFADFEVTAEPASHVIGDFQPIKTLDVTVQGVDVNTGEVEWKGNAHYPPRPRLPADGLVQLTCQALATAWGFRPSGQLEIPSQMMCTAGQTEPALSP